MARTITFHQIKELSLQYDGDGATVKGCEIHQSSAATTCTVSFTADSDMNAPVYVYYQLSNFYQVPFNNKGLCRWCESLLLDFFHSLIVDGVDDDALGP